MLVSVQINLKCHFCSRVRRPNKVLKHAESEIKVMLMITESLRCIIIIFSSYWRSATWSQVAGIKVFMVNSSYHVVNSAWSQAFNMQTQLHLLLSILSILSMQPAEGGELQEWGGRGRCRGWGWGWIGWGRGKRFSPPHPLGVHYSPNGIINVIVSIAAFFLWFSHSLSHFLFTLSILLTPLINSWSFFFPLS